MSLTLVLVCDTCLHEVEIDVDITPDDFEDFEREQGWLFDELNDSHYCPECVFEAAKELGVEYDS